MINISSRGLWKMWHRRIFIRGFCSRSTGGEINEAENELLAYVEEAESRLLETQERRKRAEDTVLNMGLSVYGYMNEKGDDFLEKIL